MSDTPKCRFSQIHLSTGIVLMLVAAWVLGFNFAPYRHNTHGYREAVSWGWPYPFLQRLEDSSVEWDVLSLLLSILYSFTVIVATAVVAECLARRQLQRSTLVVVSGLSALLLLANVRLSKRAATQLYEQGGRTVHSYWASQGFPFYFKVTYQDDAGVQYQEEMFEDESRRHIWMNVVICVSTVALAGYVAEGISRRRIQG